MPSLRKALSEKPFEENPMSHSRAYRVECFGKIRLPPASDMAIFYRSD